MSVDDILKLEIDQLKTTCNHLARRLQACEKQITEDKAYALKLYEEVKRVANNVEILDEITVKRH